MNEEPKDRLFDATEADEGRPLDVGWQKQASNQAVRLGFKTLLACWINPQVITQLISHGTGESIVGLYANSRRVGELRT